MPSSANELIASKGSPPFYMFEAFRTKTMLRAKNANYQLEENFRHFASIALRDHRRKVSPQLLARWRLALVAMKMVGEDGEHLSAIRDIDSKMLEESGEQARCICRQGAAVSLGNRWVIPFIETKFEASRERRRTVPRQR